MKIAITAGSKTINITKAVESKIEAGGDDVVTLSSLDDLIEYIDCGYRLGRIVIAEQALTDNGEVNSEDTIRDRVNNISSVISSKQRDAKTVFLTGYDDLADVIYEESLAIRADSAIVVKERPYSTSFFVSLMTDDLQKIDGELIYKPKADKNIEWEDEGENSSDSDKDIGDELGYDFVGYESEDEDSRAVEEHTSDIDWTEGIEGNTALEDNNEDTEWEESSTDDEWDDGTLENEGYEDKAELVKETPWDDDDIVEEEIGSTDEIENISTVVEEEQLSSLSDETYSGWDNGTNNDEEGWEGTGIGNQIYEDNTETQSEDTDWDDSIYEQNNSSTEDTTVASDNSGTINDRFNVDEIYGNAVHEEKVITPVGGSQNLQRASTDIYKESEKDKIIENVYKEEEEEDTETKGRIGTGFVGKRKKKVSKLRSSDGIIVGIDGGITTSELAHRMESFASRGNSIVVTGNGGTGASAVALNMANFIASLGYSVIIVDMDTQHRAQSYITKEAYNAIEAGSSDLMSAINSGSPAERFARIVRPGIHVLSMWIGGDCVPVEDIIKREKLTRFINSVKSKYNFTIYDCPFNSAVGFLQDITFTADNIVNVVDYSSWGITKFMLDCCNISSEEMQETIFNRTEIIMNKAVGNNRILGRNIKKTRDILRILDDRVVDLTGVDSGMYFSNMSIVGEIQYDRNFEEQWYGDKWYSDTVEGKTLFAQLVATTVLY